MRIVEATIASTSAEVPVGFHTFAVILFWRWMGEFIKGDPAHGHSSTVIKRTWPAFAIAIQRWAHLFFQPDGDHWRRLSAELLPGHEGPIMTVAFRQLIADRLLWHVNLAPVLMIVAS
jgi:hypothetical protein